MRQSEELARNDAMGAEKRGDCNAQPDTTGSGGQVKNQAATPADPPPHAEQKQTCHDQDRVVRLRSSRVHSEPVKKPSDQQ
jgi:hypothetical protein